MSNHENLPEECASLEETITLEEISGFLEKVSSKRVLLQDELAKIAIAEYKIKDEDLLNFTYIEAGNILNRSAYIHVPMEERILLIPHSRSPLIRWSPGFVCGSVALRSSVPIRGPFAGASSAALGFGVLDQSTVDHSDDATGLCGDAGVMRDEDKSQLALGLQTAKQVDDL